jgi:hypothetical protein
MRILTTTVLISALTLTACGTIRDSAVNPVNWFGKGRSSPVAPKDPAVPVNPLIPTNEKGGIFKKQRERDAIYLGEPIDQVTSLVIERVPGGAVIRATGVTAVQGVHSIQLTPTTKGITPIDGVLSFRLEGIRPERTQGVGSVHTRTVVAAIALTDQELSEVGTIEVQAARNTQASRRR